MQFTNHAPFPALAFAGIDQRGRSFHVVALRQAFTWGAVAAVDYQAVQEDGELDLLRSYGATLAFAAGSAGPVFRSITLHRNRDMESAGWDGGLPCNLSFEDSPETLFKKIPLQPVQQSDSALTGHAVWHVDGYTLHILYSNLDNRLLRVKLIAPGTWKCVDEC